MFQSFRTDFRFNPHEVYIKTLDVGFTVWKLVEEGLSLSEVVGFCPKVDPALHMISVEAILKRCSFERRCERTVVLQTIPEISYHLQLKKYEINEFRLGVSTST